MAGEETQELIDEAYLLARVRITGKTKILTPDSEAVARRLEHKGLAEMIGNSIELTQRGDDAAELIEAGMLMPTGGK